MHGLKIIEVLGPLDMRTIWRDGLLRWMMCLPVALALLARWAVPVILDRLAAVFPYNLPAYYPLIVTDALLLISPVMVGMVVGFLLLDERDDRTLLALQVTPLPLRNYLFYRLAAPTLLSLIMTIVAFGLAQFDGFEGLIDARFLPLLPGALTAALLAPLVALALAVFAENKVQGFALAKFSGILLITPVFAYFADSRWQLVFGLLPTFWPLKIYLALGSADPYAPLYLLVGASYLLGLSALLLARFNGLLHR